MQTETHLHISANWHFFFRHFKKRNELIFLYMVLILQKINSNASVILFGCTHFITRQRLKLFKII